MKQIRIISRYLQLGVMVFLLAACNDEYMPDETILETNSDGMIPIVLYTNTGEFERPVIRTVATDENSIQGAMPWVLVFRGGNNNALFFEASRAIMSNGKLVVPLTKTTNVSRLLIIANPPSKFFDGNTDDLDFDKAELNTQLTGKTYSQALSILNTKKLNSTQRTVPYSGEHLPMSAAINLAAINQQTTIGTPSSKISLIRIVAKVTVSNVAPGFVMDGFTVIGAKQYGRFLQGAPAVAIGNKVNYFAQLPSDPVSGISDGKTPVYIYESAAGETSIIVKGKYDGVTGYYRMVFNNGNNTETTIIRNKWYQFKIKDVKIPGYKTPQDAMIAPPSNIMTELLVADENSMEITDNGQYYMGLSNSELFVYSDTEQNNLTATTITTNAPVGVSIKVGVVAVNPAGSMTISSGSIMPDASVKTMDVKINLSKTFVSGALQITDGNLQRIVKVERKPIISSIESYLIFNPGYVFAQIDSQGDGGVEWLSLSMDGINYTDEDKLIRPDGPGAIYLKLTGNLLANITRNGGIVYLARKDSAGHLKLYINQMAGLPK